MAFPTIPPSFHLIGKFCLASLVFHHSWLRENLHQRHPVFQSLLFRSRDLIQRLEPLISCRLYQTGDPITPTGIPPHIGLMVQMKEMSTFVSELPVAIDRASRDAVQSIIRELEERAIESRAITPDRFEELLDQRF